jgi:gluconate 5-dehydrogenase
MDALSMFSLAGRRALVTGSSRGVGFALAGALAGAGADVILNSRDTAALGEAAARLAESGARVRAVAFDVTSPESTRDAVDWIEGEVGAIDVLVNNAGLQHRAPLEEFPPEKFDRIVATNLTAPFLVAQAVAHWMIPRGGGRIINVCSVLSGLAHASATPYAASKAAVANLTRGMAAEWARHGINVNGIAPGYVRTERNEALAADPEFNAWLEARTPMRRWGEVSELGGAAIFLASDAASFVNGHILYVDGGLSATV